MFQYKYIFKVELKTLYGYMQILFGYSTHLIPLQQGFYKYIALPAVMPLATFISSLLALDIFQLFTFLTDDSINPETFSSIR